MKMILISLGFILSSDSAFAAGGAPLKNYVQDKSESQRILPDNAHAVAAASVSHSVHAAVDAALVDATLTKIMPLDLNAFIASYDLRDLIDRADRVVMDTGSNSNHAGSWKPQVESPEQRLVEILSKLGDLEKIEIQHVIENAGRLRAFLVRKLSQESFARFTQLLLANPDAGKAYLAAFFTEEALHLITVRSVAWDAARDPARDAAGDATGASAGDAAWYAARDAAWVAAMDPTIDSVGDAARYVSMVADWAADLFSTGDAREVARVTAAIENDCIQHTTKSQMRLILAKLGLVNPVEIGRKSYILAELYALAWALKEGQNIWVTTFKAAYLKLGASVTIEEVKNAIWPHSISDAELNGDVHIEGLRTFLRKVEEVLPVPAGAAAVVSDGAPAAAAAGAL